MSLFKSNIDSFGIPVLKGSILVLLILQSLVSVAQFRTDSLSMIRTGGKYRYYMGQKEIRFFDVIQVTKVNPKAKQLMRYAKNNYTASNLFFGLGVISFAFGSLYYLETGDKDKILGGVLKGAFIGGMMVGVSIPLRKGMFKNTRKAIDVYNRGLKNYYPPY